MIEDYEGNTLIEMSIVEGNREKEMLENDQRLRIGPYS